MSRRLRRVAQVAGTVAIGILFVALVFRGLTADLRDGDSDPDASYRPVAVELGQLREKIVASGTLEPLVRVPVISEVPGIIAEVKVEEGDRVVRGQALFELDRERLEARVASRQAELRLRAANARFDLLGRAQADLDRARRESERLAELHARGVVSQRTLDDAEHASRLAEIGDRDAHAELAARRAAVDQAREQLRQAERDLANATVRAPIDGVIIRRDGEVGRAVADVTSNGGTVVAVIADDRRIRLIAEVDENDIARVRVGQAADVSFDAFPEEKFTGRVRKISPAGITVSKVANFEVEITIEADERLRVGMSADARVIVAEHRDVLLLPNLAFVRSPSGPQVRATDVGGGPNHHVVSVELGASDGFQTVVTAGLSEGDVVLVRSGGSPR